MFQGVDQDLLLQSLQMTVPLLEAHPSRQDDLLPDGLAFLVGEQVLERREIEDAMAEQVVAELLAGRLAPEVDQFAFREVEPAHPIVLFQNELAAATHLPDGAEQHR